jgi:lysophospholipase L1-like esterase
VLARAAALLVGCLLALAILEVGVRLVGPETPGRFTRSDPITGWAHVPGSEGWWTGDWGEFRAWVRINRLGLRDREIAEAREPGTVRLLTLGDSITAAFQVDLAETFQKGLEARLGRRDGRRYEVVNAGVNGFGTDQALLYYRHRGAALGPDVVVLMFYLGNDLKDNHPGFRASFSNYAKPHFRLAGGRLELVDFPYRLTAAQRWREQTKEWLAPLRVYRLAYVASVRLGANPRRWLAGTADAAPAREDDPAVWERAWAVTRALLLELRREVEGRGARLLVALVPPPDAVDAAYWDKVGRRVARPEGLDDPREQEAMLLSFLRAQRFAHLSLRPALEDAFVSGGRPLYYDLDRHLNPEGHAVVARTLDRHLVEARLLEPAR